MLLSHRPCSLPAMTLPDPHPGAPPAPAALTPQSVTPLFFTPLVRFALPEAASLNPALLAEIAALRAADPGVRRSNRAGWHSRDDLFDRREPALAHLAARLREAALAATRQLAPAPLEGMALQCEGWVNVNPPGGFNTPHDHPGWMWSGTYYVAVPDALAADPTAGCIEFLDSRTNLRVLPHLDAAFLEGKHTVRPQPGQLLLFPSYLRHWVHPGAGPGERVSVAFNARIVPSPVARRAPA